MKRFMAVFFYLILCISGTSAQVAVIAHKSVPLDTVKAPELLNFFTGDVSFWSGGEPIIIFDFKTKSEVKDTFYNFLGISSSRIKSIWMKRMLSGDADPPEFLKSEEDMLKKVASTAGAIGFVSQSKVSGEVKVLVVIKPTK